MNLQLSIQVWRKGTMFIATCPELDFISQGCTRDEARENLLEVIEIQFEEMSEMGTLEEYLEECGYMLQKNTAISQSEMVSFEK
jgi:predicted RNase H-like HicB family nuclease